MYTPREQPSPDILLGERRGLESSEYGRRGSAALTMRHFSIRKKIGTNFADKRRSLGRYSSLENSGQGVWFRLDQKCR
jgi:hypothetical protein